MQITSLIQHINDQDQRDTKITHFHINLKRWNMRIIFFNLIHLVYLFLTTHTRISNNILYQMLWVSYITILTLLLLTNKIQYMTYCKKDLQHTNLLHSDPLLLIYSTNSQLWITCWGSSENTKRSWDQIFTQSFKD